MNSMLNFSKNLRTQLMSKKRKRNSTNKDDKSSSINKKQTKIEEYFNV